MDLLNIVCLLDYSCLAVKAFSYGRAGDLAVVTVDTTAIPRLIVRVCMKNPLLRESI